MPAVPYYESNTWYAALANSGTRVTFAGSHSTVMVQAVGAIFWVRPRGANEDLGASPSSSPIPAAGGVTPWIRLQDGTSLSWGADDAHSTGERTTRRDLLVALDAWAEGAGGDLIVVAH